MSLLGGSVDERAMLLSVWIGEMILKSAMKKISSRSSDMIAPHVAFFIPRDSLKMIIISKSSVNICMLILFISIMTFNVLAYLSNSRLRHVFFDSEYNCSSRIFECSHFCVKSTLHTILHISSSFFRNMQSSLCKKGDSRQKFTVGALNIKTR